MFARVRHAMGNSSSSPPSSTGQGSEEDTYIPRPEMLPERLRAKVEAQVQQSLRSTLYAMQSDSMTPGVEGRPRVPLRREARLTQREIDAIEEEAEEATNAALAAYDEEHPGHRDAVVERMHQSRAHSLTNRFNGLTLNAQ